MTKEDIARVDRDSRGAPSGSPGAPPPDEGAASRPAGPPLVPAPWSSRWLDAKGGDIARPHLFARYAVRYRQGKASSPEAKGTKLFPLAAASPGEVLEGEALDAADLRDAPPRALRYEPLPGWLGPAGVKEAEKALGARLPDRLAARLLLDPSTQKLSAPGEDAEAFAARIAAEAAPPAALEARLEKKRRELEAATQQESARERETWTTGVMAAADLLGGLLGRRKSLRTGKVGSVLSKKRMEGAAESRVAELKAEIAELEAQTGRPDAARFQEVEVVPGKGNVDLLSVGVAWVS